MRHLAGPVLLLAVLTLSACGGDGKPNATPTPTKPAKSEVSTAYDHCTSKDTDEVALSDYMELQDEGRSVAVSRGADGDATGDIAETLAIGCLLGSLDAPESTFSLIQETTALMGRQTDSWGDYTIIWSYHPDSGLDAVIRGS